jgi:hypothetical protein
VSEHDHIPPPPPPIQPPTFTINLDKDGIPTPKYRVFWQVLLAVIIGNLITVWILGQVIAEALEDSGF